MRCQSDTRTPLNTIYIRHRINLQDVELPVFTFKDINRPKVHSQCIHGLNTRTYEIDTIQKVIRLLKLEPKPMIPRVALVLTLALVLLLINGKGYTLEYPYAVLSIGGNPRGKKVLFIDESSSLSFIMTDNDVFSFRVVYVTC